MDPVNSNATADAIAEAAYWISALLAEHGPRRPLKLARHEQVRLDEMLFQLDTNTGMLRRLLSGQRQQG